MDSQLLRVADSTIGYLRFGWGPEVVICFHGFGEDASGFAFLEKYAGDLFTFYAIDLPFHGQTNWNEGSLFTKEVLQQTIDEILVKENEGLNIQQLHFSVLGFSLGGRIALSLYQRIPERIKRIVLLAPDGLKVNFWYWFATQTSAGNKLFAYTMKRPAWFFAFLKILNKLNFVNTSVFKFVTYYIGKEEARLLLYKRWTALRKIKPRLKKIKSAIRRFNTPARLLYGRHDRIILSSVGRKFQKGIEKNCSLTLIESGHQVLHEKYVKDILAALKE